MSKSIPAWVAAILISLSAHSQNVLNYHPLAKGLTLGKSFDLFNTSVSYASNIFSRYNIIRSGPTSQQVYMSVIDSKQTYLNTFHIDASLDASFLSLFKANGSYKSDESQFYSENNLTVCITGEADYGDFKIDAPVISPDATVIASNPVSFKQKYGEFYVSTVHKKQYLYVFITLNNISQSMKQQISAELDVGAGFAVFSADVQGHLNKIVEQFRSSHSVQLSVRSFGRNAMSNIPLADITNDFFANGTFSSNTYSSILGYINTHFSPDNASEVEYTFSPLSQFGYRDDDYFNKITRKYQKYVALCAELGTYYNYLTEINQAKTSSGFSLRTNDDNSYINSTNSKINDRIDDIVDALAACRQSECVPMSSCCRIGDIADPVDNNKLDQIRNRYLSPLYDLATFQNAGSIRYDLRPTPSVPGVMVDIFTKQSSQYAHLNVSPANQNKYVIQASLNFINNLPGHATYIITIFLNGYPMGSGKVEAGGHALTTYNFTSEPTPVGAQFFNKLPENVRIHIELANYEPVPGIDGFYITMLPYSRLLFIFN